MAAGLLRIFVRSKTSLDLMTESQRYLRLVTCSSCHKNTSFGYKGWYSRGYHTTVTRLCSKTKLSNFQSKVQKEKQRQSSNHRKKGQTKKEEANKNSGKVSKNKPKSSPIQSEGKVTAKKAESVTVTASVSNLEEQSPLTKGIVSEEEEFLALESLHVDSALHVESMVDDPAETQEMSLISTEEFLETDEGVLHNEDVESGTSEDVDSTSTSDAELESKTDISWWRREDTIGGKLFEVRTLAEIDGFLNVGQVGEAQKLLNRYLRLGRKLETKYFNKMLHGWAEQENLATVKMLYQVLQKEELVEPDIGTYGALLHAYGKFADKDGIKKILQDLEDKGLNVKFLFHSCSLTEQQAKDILYALRLVDPNFEAEIPPIDNKINYPPLVKNLYNRRKREHYHLSGVPAKFAEEFAEENIVELFEEQMAREICGVTRIKSIEEEGSGTVDNTKLKELLIQWKDQWKKDLTENLAAELAEIKAKKRAAASFRPRYAPFFQAFEAEELAEITIDEVIFMIKGQVEGVPLQSLSGLLGTVLNNKTIVKNRVQTGMLPKVKDMYKDYVSYLMDDKMVSKQMPRERWLELDEARPYGASLRQDIPRWPWATRVVTGCALIDFLLKSVKVNVNMFTAKPEKFLPAFYHSYDFRDSKKVGIIKPHPLVCKLFKAHLASQGEINMATTAVPMLVPPRPWTDVRDGAFLIQPAQLIRTHQDEDAKHDQLLEKKTGRHDLVAVFDALNYLGSCAWRANKRILGLAIEVFNSGGNDVLAIPGPPSQPTVDVLDIRTSSTDPAAKSKMVAQRRLEKKHAHEQHALRMTVLYKLSVANEFRDNVFWLPLNMDFRGRVYPIPPHCSHIGDDLSRGMLQFAKGAELGEKGLEWLKIHLVNLHGEKKKASLKERAQFAEEIMEEILDSADNPLTGRRWWMSGDYPWQVLATCMEIAAAVRSPDATKFVSHLPVHQDGSCNGLQHYAALGHDQYGAKQVNLVPSDRPQDVYAEEQKLKQAQEKGKDPCACACFTSCSFAKAVFAVGCNKNSCVYFCTCSCVASERVALNSAANLNFQNADEVAKLVEIAREYDAAAGREVAKQLAGKISRKVVKQPVMTVVYGVTFVGGRLQIERQLKDLDVDDKIMFEASAYLISKVFASIGEMFSSARQIQDWLTISAHQIALSGHPVDWFTPLGLYASQPYCKRAVKRVPAKIQVVEIRAENYSQKRPDTRRQRAAFPPNFVHALDSTHMMLTALQCERAGVAFASVHDSFWTHAANVDVMSKACREQFVALHSQPILQDLHKHFQDSYDNLKLVRPMKVRQGGEEHLRTHASFIGLPDPGDFDLKEVLNSTYFFS